MKEWGDRIVGRGPSRIDNLDFSRVCNWEQSSYCMVGQNFRAFNALWIFFEILIALKVSFSEDYALLERLLRVLKSFSLRAVGLGLLSSLYISTGIR